MDEVIDTYHSNTAHEHRFPSSSIVNPAADLETFMNDNVSPCPTLLKDITNYFPFVGKPRS